MERLSDIGHSDVLRTFVECYINVYNIVCPLGGIRNAFNTARWKICIEAMVQKKVPDYPLLMIDDYLNDTWAIYEGDEWSLKEEMTCGAPQGSRINVPLSYLYLHGYEPTYSFTDND